MKIKDLRRIIDNIDDELIYLVNRRMETAVRIQNQKSYIRDPEREKSIIEHIKQRSSNCVSPDHMEKLFKIIMSQSRKIQETDKSVLVFQGEHGAYSESAAACLSPDSIALGSSSFSSVFNNIRAGRADSAVVPVENSIGGAITEVNRLLSDEFSIIAETTIPIHHTLLTRPGTDYRQIKSVISHPQALSQCSDFLSRHDMHTVEYSDTAAAARMLSQKKQSTAAVIADRRCAEIYNLSVVSESIGNTDDNHTRFLLLKLGKPAITGAKTSILFSAADTPGSLGAVFSIFNQRSVNLTRIESIPISLTPRKYRFFLDFASSWKKAMENGIVHELEKCTDSLSLLGSYDEKHYVQSTMQSKTDITGEAT